MLLLDSMVAALYNLVSLHRSAVNKVPMALQEVPKFDWRGHKIHRLDSLGCKFWMMQYEQVWVVTYDDDGGASGKTQDRSKNMHFLLFSLLCTC
eukprot:10007475-Ditylum_brightwellii.AAC.1